MADTKKLESLIDLLKDILSEGKEINSSEFPFISINGDIDGKGILWKGDGYNKQFVFSKNPDRFFVSESIDLAREKNISINNIKLIDENSLGDTITKSSLQEVGRLKGLIVDGGFSINQYMIYDPINDRLGLGTDQPHAALSIADQNVEIVLGSFEPNVGRIGAYNSADLELVTDNTPRITIQAGGNIVLGNPSTGDSKITIIGKLGINVSNPDPRSALHINGALKFNDKLHLSGDAPPISGTFNDGDIVWNVSPYPGKFVGWVCTRAGSPGLWSGFGRIE